MVKLTHRDELNPVAVLGYFLGALSVLNMLSDVLQVRSDLFLWINSYGQMVERLGR